MGSGRGLLGALVVALTLTACGTDDGTGVRQIGDEGSGSGAGSASGTGSGSGLSTEEVDATTDDEQVLAALEAYKAYVTEQIDLLVERTTVFTDAVRAGDVAAAQEAYAPSREPWERIEPIAGLVEEIDGAVDLRVDDFAGPDDPGWTGWHRLEYLLWEQDTTEGAAEVADQLDADLLTLQSQMTDLDLPPAAVGLGAAELIEEVSAGKITGEEDRYSKTDLWDFNANVEGAEQVVELLTPALEATDPELLTRIEGGFDELNTSLEEFREGDGWVPYCLEDDEFPSDVCSGTTVTSEQVTLLTAQLAALSEDLALVPGTLGLR